VVDGGLGEHGVVLELRLAERGSVGSDDDQLGLPRVTLPDFITRASLELIWGMALADHPEWNFESW
jgi:hypothetical protein